MKNMIAAFFLVAAVAGRAQAFGLHELNIAVQSVGGSCPSAATQIIAPDPAVVGPIYPASLVIGTANLSQLRAYIGQQEFPVVLAGGQTPNLLWRVLFSARPVAVAGTTANVTLVGYRCGRVATSRVIAVEFR